MALPWEDGHDDRRGWDRASIANRSAKPYRPAISQRDLLLPTTASRLRAFGLCFVCAACMTVLYVWFPLFIAGLFVELGPWPVAVALCAVAGLTPLVFWLSVREDRELRVLARDL
jgi:hypothetical protein